VDNDSGSGGHEKEKGAKFFPYLLLAGTTENALMALGGREEKGKSLKNSAQRSKVMKGKKKKKLVACNCIRLR